MNEKFVESLQTKEIVKVLPHRYPFLLVDRILECDLEAGKIVGKKNLTINEPFFQGHFPETPLMPGVLILEALAQTGGILVHLKDNRNKIAVLLTVHEAKFRHAVKPGDTLLLHAELLHLGTRGGKVSAKAYVDDLLVAESQIGFALLDEKQI